MHKNHSWVPIFGVQKTKSSFQLVWTTFVHYLLWSKIKSIGTVCGLPTHNIFRTLIKLPNFSFDVQSHLLDLISFRDAHFTVDVWAIVCATNWMHKWNMLARSFPLLQGWQSKVAQDLGALSTVSPSHDMNFLSHVIVLGHQNLSLRSLMSVFKHQNFSFVVPR